MTGRKLHPIAMLAFLTFRACNAVGYYVITLAGTIVSPAANYAAMSAEFDGLAGHIATVPAGISKIRMTITVSSMASIATEVDNVHNVARPVFDDMSMHFRILLNQVLCYKAKSYQMAIEAHTWPE